MPELPEVHTTATILNKLVKGKIITEVWTDYNSPYYYGKDSIKDPAYFSKFKKSVTSKKITRSWRRGKNVLIDLEDGSSILIHMKMTGHLLYGNFVFNNKTQTWKASTPGPLQDPFNRFVHLVFSLSDGNHIAFSDMRKFATVYLIKDKNHLENVFAKMGPEPLEDDFDSKVFKERLTTRINYKIKTALMDPALVAGIGNIYSDEILWASKIHPERTVQSIKDKDYKNMVNHTKEILSKGISFGGDSMSDYRNPYGVPGEFQLHHNAYQRNKLKCKRKSCKGTIERKVIGGRSAHFCPLCQE